VAGGLRHHAPELSFGREFNPSGAAMEDDMAVDTAVDTELWLIVAAMVGWVALGCFVTARRRHPTTRKSPRIQTSP